VLFALGISAEQTVLYGSLALERTDFVNVLSANRPLQLSQLLSRPAVAEVRTSYITDRSDVDYAILLPEGMQASSLVNRILSTTEAGWRHEQATVVPRFAVSQWTLVNAAGVHLDLTCFTDEVQFNRFRERQMAFREVFWQTRQYMQTAYQSVGILAFDAYIYVLKAFAAVVSRSAFTSFQAVCLGLFVLQHSRQQKMLVPSAPWLFNNFLCFCNSFFGGKGSGNYRKGSRSRQWCGSQAMDLSGRGRLMPRLSHRARAELYFVSAEERCQAPVAEWQNVLHNSDPETICEAAETALQDWFGARGPMAAIGRLRKDRGGPPDRRAPR